MERLIAVGLGGALLYLGVHLIRRASSGSREAMANGRIGTYQGWSYAMLGGVILLLLGIGAIVAAAR